MNVGCPPFNALTWPFSVPFSVYGGETAPNWPFPCLVLAACVVQRPHHMATPLGNPISNKFTDFELFRKLCQHGFKFFDVLSSLDLNVFFVEDDK